MKDMEVAESQGAVVQALIDRPELMPGLYFYLEAYGELLTERGIGMDYGPIPWSSIHKYGAHCDLDDDEIEVLVSHIRALEKADREFKNDK